MKLQNLYLVFFVLISSNAHADKYHYRDVLIGERAAGLGGAYIAISDDPSGMYYNPAGILFSFENYFSLSANAYSMTNIKYKDVLPGKDYEYKSGGLVASFFGFTQNWRKSKLGFAIITPRSDLFDQDDQIDVTSGAGLPNQLTRKYFRSNTQTLLGPAFATEMFKDFAIGVSGFLSYNVDKAIDQQVTTYNSGGSASNTLYNIDMRSINNTSIGFHPKIGIQYMPIPKLSLGATLTQGVTLSGSKTVKRTYTELNGTVPADPDGNLSTNLPRTKTNSESQVLAPLEIGLGVAYFHSKQLMLTSDFIYYGSDERFTEFNTVSTFNYSLGLEYYLSEASAFRFGFFTNNSNTPKVENGKANQNDSVDLFGIGSSITTVSSGSSFTFGFYYSSGIGQGQAVGNSTTVQDIEMSNTTVYLTGSYQL